MFLLDIYAKGQQVSLSRKDKAELAKVLEQIEPAYRAGIAAATTGKQRK